VEKIDFSKFEKGIFMVNLVGIVYNKHMKKMIIGKRENDPYIEELSWAFPGARASYDKDLWESLRLDIKKKAGINAEIKKLIFARITPEIKRKQIILYYYCETSEENLTPGGTFKEVKWASPAEFKDYFTTSVNPEIADFLNNLK